MEEFIILKDGSPIAKITQQGVLKIFPDVPIELSKRLIGTLISGIPEGERLTVLLNHISQGKEIPISSARVLYELADLPGGMELVPTSFPTLKVSQYIAPPKRLKCFSSDGMYVEPCVDVHLSKDWYDIGKRIRELQPHPSFCGVQDKFTAVVEYDNTNFSIRPIREKERGNVIIKPHRSDVPFLPEVEFICMQIARVCRFSTADCFLFESPIQGRQDIRIMDLAVCRFDRNEDGTPIEVVDLASMLGLDNAQKYIQNRLDMLLGVSSFLQANELAKLTEALFFGTLIGNGDMHLKNFSVIHDQNDDRWKLAPLYDMVSTEALRYEMRLGMPVHRNAYNFLSREEIKTGGSSIERLNEIIASIETSAETMISSVLMCSDRPGYFMGHSQARRMVSVVRKHIVEARDILKHIIEDVDVDNEYNIPF